MQIKNNNKKVIFGSRENENHIFESLTLEELNGVIELRKHINLKKGEKLFLKVKLLKVYLL